MRNSVPNSLFDTVEDKKAKDDKQPHTDTSSSDPQTEDINLTKSPLDQEVSSIFTKSTIEHPLPIPSRFNFLRRNKSSPDKNPLLPDEPRSEKKKSRFENPFKPHQVTEEDRIIMERIKKRLGNREEAIKLGGQQPAGYKGIGGGAYTGPWNGGV